MQEALYFGQRFKQFHLVSSWWMQTFADGKRGFELIHLILTAMSHDGEAQFYHLDRSLFMKNHILSTALAFKYALFFRYSS